MSEEFVLPMRDGRVPQFSHSGEKWQCGSHCARYLLESEGRAWTLENSRRLFTSPKGMHRVLAKSGTQYACVRRQSKKGALAWLSEQIRNKHRPVALFVRSNIFVPFPTRWVVVCGVQGDNFLVYDDRIGDRAKSAVLPAGNVIWSARELFARWNAPLSRRLSAVKILEPQESLLEKRPISKRKASAFAQWDTEIFKKGALFKLVAND